MADLVVLVVEDSAVHRRLLQEAFKASGIPTRLEFCADADQAWGVIERMHHQSAADWPDFAIVDIGLPGPSGIELVDRVRQLRHFEDWPIVMLTASQDPDDRKEAMLAHATGYFLKPTTSSGYLQLVRDILAFVGRGPTPKAKDLKAPAQRRRDLN